MTSIPEPYAPDPYRQWDAAYVLGALSPAERREFEQHLAGCPVCQAAVAELAGMPGLLAQVSPDDAATFAASTLTDDQDIPPQLLTPRTVSELRTKRRLVRALIGLAAALVLLVGVGGVFALRGDLPGTHQSATAPFRLAFSPVVASGIIAIVDVVPLKQGTQLNVECQYGEANEPTPGGGYAKYAIWIIDRSGHSMLAKEWDARPNRMMKPQASSPLPVAKIRSVEIRQVDTGQTLLRATLQ